jgi:hypothetical protein
VPIYAINKISFWTGEHRDGHPLLWLKNRWRSALAKTGGDSNAASSSLLKILILATGRTHKWKMRRGKGYLIPRGAKSDSWFLSRVLAFSKAWQKFESGPTVIYYDHWY